MAGSLGDAQTEQACRAALDEHGAAHAGVPPSKLARRVRALEDLCFGTPRVAGGATADCQRKMAQRRKRRKLEKAEQQQQQQQALQQRRRSPRRQQQQQQQSAAAAAAAAAAPGARRMKSEKT